jgi:2-C-methyl-D-erythritol 2,4-cyclodiphosphate synthase
MDALLGAAGLGDIGLHFPDNEAYYKAISSLLLLKKTNEKIKKEGFSIINIDATIVAQQPKLAPYRADMIKNLSQVLQIDPHAVNIKATTEEGLGFTGQRLGIAAYAVCLLYKE